VSNQTNAKEECFLTNARSPKCNRRAYDALDHAAVHNALTRNQDNVKRTARETGVPENTVRRWRNHWRVSGAPSHEDTVHAQQIVGRRAQLEQALGTALLRDVLNAAQSDDLSTRTVSAIGRKAVQLTVRALAVAAFDH